MVKKIKMIALDLDGTTLADGGILTENTKQVLEEACRRGVHIVVAQRALLLLAAGMYPSGRRVGIFDQFQRLLGVPAAYGGANLP